MKRWSAPAFLIFLLFIFTISCGNGDGLDFQRISSMLQRMIEDKWTAYGADKANWDGGIAMYVISPRGIFFSSTGFDPDVDRGVHFRAASTTKNFTAAAILLLHQEGRLHIDQAVTDLIPGKSEPYVPMGPGYDIPYKSQITIRQLLEHRAGVFDVSNDPVPATANAPYAGKYYITYIREDLGQQDHTFTFDELVGVVAQHQLSYTPPDTEFHYSNTGYSILGKIIERVSGQTYAEFIQARFLTPLELTETHLPSAGDDTAIPSPFAAGYLYFQSALYEVTQDNMSPHVAEGNVITTPEELTRWIKLLLGGQAGLNPETVKLMTAVQATGEHHQYYGLGCMFTPGLGYGHNGGHIGYMTVMRYDPEYDLAMVIFASVLNADDLQGQLDEMYDIGLSARQILGYPKD